MSLTRLLADRTGLLREFDHVKGALSRRKWLLGLSGLGALWQSTAHAGSPPTSDEMWLVDRLTMGRTPSELQLAESLGYQGYLQYHLNYQAIDDSAMDAMLVNYTTLTMQPYQLIPLPSSQVVNELTEATILRSVFSRRQLFQRMVEFWTDHFNIDINIELCSYLKSIDDRDVIRANALGMFPALLTASAHSPAMLVYLNNNNNIATARNENYSRELMELHTLSVAGPYTQQDVQEVARCFTGWTLYGTSQNPQELRWTFRYNNVNHDNGAKTVLGTPIPGGGGVNDGATVLNLLINHPNTAGFIAKKLCKWFYSETPPQALIDAVANTYVVSNGDIKQMVSTLFTTAQSMLPAPLKYKRPYHMFISALRASEATIANTSTFRSIHLAGAGQIPFNWGPPDGYPDTLANWVGLILPRWSFGASLWHATNNSAISGIAINTSSFFTALSAATTAQAVVDLIDQRFFGSAMDTAQKNRIRQYVLPDPPTIQRKREAVGLAIDSPAFQWY